MRIQAGPQVSFCITLVSASLCVSCRIPVIPLPAPQPVRWRQPGECDARGRRGLPKVDQWQSGACVGESGRHNTDQQLCPFVRPLRATAAHPDHTTPLPSTTYVGRRRWWSLLPGYSLVMVTVLEVYERKVHFLKSEKKFSSSCSQSLNKCFHVQKTWVVYECLR